MLTCLFIDLETIRNLPSSSLERVLRHIVFYFLKKEGEKLFFRQNVAVREQNRLKNANNRLRNR